LEVPPTRDDLLALDEALTQFAREEPAKAELVQLRYFAGLTLEEAAGMLQISRATASRYWTSERDWLYDYISSFKHVLSASWGLPQVGVWDRRSKNVPAIGCP